MVYYGFMARMIRDFRSSYTFRLRKAPLTFLDGVVAILGAEKELMSKYNTDRTDTQADLNSLKSDWQAVGDDMYTALNKFEHEWE